MQKYFNYWLDERGEPIRSGTVQVNTSAGAAATLYDENGATVTNPLTTDSSGYFEFYAPNGRYTLSLSKSGYTTTTIPNVLLDDPTVATIAALRAAGTPTTSNARISVLGYTTAGDGGGGDFYWDSTSSDADDNGITILPTGYAGTGRWKRVDTVVITPEMFGAVGDGSTDDATALNAIPAGSNVNLNGKTYLAASNLSLSGEFANGTLLLSGTAKIAVAGPITLNISVNLTDSHRGDWLSANLIDGIRFGHQFIYDGNSSGIGTITTTADMSEADITNCTNISVIGATFKNSNGTPLRITDCTDITVVGNYCDNCLGLVAYGGTGVDTCAFVRFQRCEDIVAVGNRGRLIDDNVFSGIGIKRAVISDNVFEDVRHLAIIHDDSGLACDDVVVSNNIAKGCETGVILGWWDGSTGYPCTGVILNGNILHSGTTAAATAWSKTYGIRFRYSTTDCLITNNTIEATYQAVIASTSADANLPNDGVTRNKFRNNTFVTAVDASGSPVCILEDTGGTANEYIGNTIRSNASVVAGSVQMVNVGESTIFKANNVRGVSGYGESVFRAGSVVRENEFNVIGVLAGATAYELVNNDFTNGADINETGTAVQISGNRGSTNKQILVNFRKIIEGSGSPEGVVTALIGSIYMRQDGGAGTSMYVKESGTGNTGWVAK